MFAVAKEDLDALKKRKFKLIFVLGGPGTGKGTQCAKLVDEFKYIHISTGDLIRDEIKKKSKLGEVCGAYANKGALVPFELIISILIKAILTRKGNNFLIDGFPRSMEQALYLDKFIKEIRVILNVYASEEISLNRILKRGETSGRADDSKEETVRNRLKEFKEQSQPVIDFYQKYGVVRHINSEFDVNTVYEQVKENLYPEIYCIIGKKYSGKTTIANKLAKRMCMKVIDFKEFLNEPSISKKKNDDDFVITQFINRLREEESARVIIEDFPLKKENYTQFVKNCKKIQKIFYLNVDDNNASNRMRDLGLNHANYIGCASLNQHLDEFNQKKDVLDFLRKRSNLIEIDVNNHLPLVMDNIVSKVQPTVLLFKSDSEVKYLEIDLICNFQTKYNFEVVDVDHIIRESISRYTLEGKEIEKYQTEMKLVPNRLVLEVLKPILFRETQNKFILINYPKNCEGITEFENEVCKIQKLVYLHSSYPLGTNTDNLLEENVEIYFKKENRIFLFNTNANQTEYNYMMEEVLGNNRNFQIVYGMPLSGKTAINSHMEKKYNYRLIDMNKVVTSLKAVKGAALDADPDSVEFSLPELIKGFADLIQLIPKEQKFCLENIFNEFIVDNEQAFNLLRIAGKPRVFFELECEEMVLVDRFKVKNEIGEDLTEDQKATFDETIEKHKKIREFIRENSYKVRKLNTNLSEYKTLMLLDATYGRNLIVLKHDYDLDVENTIYNLSTSHKVLYVSVPNLIYRQFLLNTHWAKKLENTYCKKAINQSSNLIYSKYNPIHFDEKLVEELILEYITENSKDIEDNDNLIILSGFLNNDLLADNERSFNLPLLEIKKLNNLGNISAYVHVTKSNENIPIREYEVPERIIIEEPVKPQIDILNQSGDDQNAPQDDQPVDPEEENKFKPEKYEWTNYDGNARNYIQIITRLTKLDVSEQHARNSEANLKLFNILADHIIKWQSKDINYRGLINILRIAN